MADFKMGCDSRRNERTNKPQTTGNPRRPTSRLNLRPFLLISTSPDTPAFSHGFHAFVHLPPLQSAVLPKTSYGDTISASSGLLQLYIIQNPCVSLQRGHFLCLFTLLGAEANKQDSQDILCILQTFTIRGLWFNHVLYIYLYFVESLCSEKRYAKTISR